MTETQEKEPQEKKPQETRTLTAHCYCKAVHFTVTLPTSALPLHVRLCHCSICRQTHGTLCIFHADLPDGVAPQFIAPSSMATLTGYRHATAVSERYFCSTCSAQIGDVGIGADGKADGGWVVSTSLFDQHGPDVFQISVHCFTPEPAGADLAACLPRMRDQPMKVWNPPKDEVQAQAQAAKSEVKELPQQQLEKLQLESKDAGRDDERLLAECHCGGVSFSIPRPTVPAVTNDSFLRKYVSPLDKTKWMACMDICDDCRLMSGAHVIAWTFIPLALTEPRVPASFDGVGTLKSFKSSDDVLRGFCGRCGATVLYAVDERAPTEEQRVVDVAVGVLRSPRDALATDWLTWRTARVAWFTSGQRYDPDFAAALAQGLDEWGIKQYGEEIRDFKMDI